MIRYKFNNDPTYFKRLSARTYTRCLSCDNGIDRNGCECRKCEGTGAVTYYRVPTTDWKRPARPQL